LECDPAAVRLDDLPRDEQSETEAAALPRVGGALETPEYAFAVRRTDASAMVADGEYAFGVWRATLTSVGLPGAYFTAFVTRFVITCSRR
jgi:hypothetical protein